MSRKSKTFTDEQPKLTKINLSAMYTKPDEIEGQPHTKFDYSNLTGEDFMEYNEILQGDVKQHVANGVSLRVGNGLLNVNKDYYFDLYMVSPLYQAIDPTNPTPTKIVSGFVMKDGKAVRKGMKMKLSTALLLNANLPAGTNQIPVEYFLLSQNKEIK
jgi:hypothetical protein